jgi:hypothetical protein
LLFNDAGQVGFKPSLTGTDLGAADNSAIFRGSGGAATEIAREGDSAPGGGLLGSLADGSMNESGQIAFESAITGSTSTRGIFVGSGGDYGDRPPQRLGGR